MEVEALERPHSFVFIDEAGFNLAKTRRRGRNVIGQRATVAVSGQRVWKYHHVCCNGQWWFASQHTTHWPIQHRKRLIALREQLYAQLVPAEQGEPVRNPQVFVIVCDNVAFHHSAAVTDWFAAHHRFMVLYLPAYSPFLNPIEEFFSAWRWKVFGHHPHDQMSLLEAMCAGCEDTSPEDCQGWIRHSRRFFPRCMARENIVMWCWRKPVAWC